MTVNCVPTTSLRHFYGFLRDFPALSIHKDTCAKLLKQEAEENRLQSLFDSSMREFELYDNEGEDFHPTRPPPQWWPKYLESSDEFARSIVARMAPSRRDWTEIVGVQEKIRSVDYEVFTRRTTGKATFADGAPVQGSGGVDLLLSEEGTPVVGEVKAKGGMNAFFALVQGLTYAIELATTPQIRRLRRVYADHFRDLDDNARVGILIISEDATVPLLTEAMKLAQCVMRDRSQPIPQRVKFISFVHGELGEAGALRLSLLGKFES